MSITKDMGLAQEAIDLDRLVSRILLAKDSDIITVDGIDLIFGGHAGGSQGCWLVRKKPTSPISYLRLKGGTIRALFYSRQEMIDTIINNRYIIDGEKTKMICPSKEIIDPLTRIENAERELALAREALIQAKKEAEPNWYDGMPVLVRNTHHHSWSKRVLKRVLSKDGYRYEAYVLGASSGDTACWGECKPDYDAPSRLTWIPNTGAKPEVSRVLVKFKDGKLGVYNRPQDFNWDRGTSNDVIEYAILVKG